MKKESKMPFGRVLLRTIKCFFAIANQWQIWLSYAFLMSLISLVFRRWGYGCITDTNGFWCATNDGGITIGTVTKYVLYYVLTIIAILAYIHDYYQSAFCGKTFAWINLFVFSKAKIKSVGFLMLNLFCFFIMGCMAYFLIRKPANPNWMIEFIYFLIVFLAFLIPLIAIRVASFISCYLQDGHMPNLMRIYKDTTGCSFTPLVLFFLSVMLSTIILIQSSVYLRALNLQFNNFAATFLSEIAGYVVILVCYSLIVAVFRAQHEILMENFVSRETLAAQEAEKGSEERQIKKTENKKDKKIKSNRTSKKSKTKRKEKQKMHVVKVK